MANDFFVRRRTRVRPAPEEGATVEVLPAAEDLLNSSASIEVAGPQRIAMSAQIEQAQLSLFPKPNRSIREFSKREVRKHADGMKAHEHRPVVLATRQGEVIRGRLHVEAYRLLDVTTIPVIFVDGKSDAQMRAMRLWYDDADHAGTMNMAAVKIDIEVILEDEPLIINHVGLEMAQIDLALSHNDEEDDVAAGDSGASDTAEALNEPGCTRPGDVWVWPDGHRLICGNSKLKETYERLMQGRKARLVLSDVPYGTKIAGVVSSKHGEFVDGSNMTEPETVVFFGAFFEAMLDFVESGAWVFTFIDWKSLYALTTAVRAAGLEQKSLIVVDKTTANRGGLYKNQAEFIILSKWGDGPSINNVQMGRYGRSRSNVWQVQGYAGFRSDRDEALAVHSTVKPLGCLLPALLDASNIGDIVLDPFMGSGSLMVAAQRVGRISYGSELDPKYVDVAVHRMHKLTGEYPVHEELGLSYPEVLVLRAAEQAAAPDAEVDHG